MILKPRLEDIKIIFFYLGKIMIGLGLVMVLPALLGLALGEVNPMLDFVLALEVTLILGLILTKLCATSKDLNWMHGMIVVSLSWLVAMVLGAIPLYLSGHWKSFLDACFDTMSGFTTTGLTLVCDLDHLSNAHNLWRHFGPFIGGQGITVVALSFFVKGTSGAFKMYVGEARDEKLAPNVIDTARFIWFISIVYLIIGTLSLGVAGIFLGMRPFSAFFHGVCIFMAGFDTAGFAPQSQNILYYHSVIYEVIIVIIMIAGALNFNLHYQLWIGNRKEIYKNIESKIFLLSVSALVFVVAVGLQQMHVYDNAVVLFRKGFFQVISGHTTTGYMTIYAQQFISEWGNFALVGLICVMAIGGSACSTAGGIKILRLGIIFKALKEDLKRIILPEKAVIVQKYHHIKDVFLEDKTARAALLITLCYIVLYGVGSLVGMFYGHSFLTSLFESTSAAANVGLSCGITSVDMPVGLKLTYIVQMWAGRLEFMSIFTLIGFLVAAVKGK